MNIFQKSVSLSARILNIVLWYYLKNVIETIKRYCRTKKWGYARVIRDLGEKPHFWYLALNSHPIFGLIGGITYGMDAPLTCNRSLWKWSAVVHLQICQNCKPLFSMVSTVFCAEFGNTIEHVYVHIYDYYMVSKTSELKR